MAARGSLDAFRVRFAAKARVSWPSPPNRSMQRPLTPRGSLTRWNANAIGHQRLRGRPLPSRKAAGQAVVGAEAHQRVRAKAHRFDCRRLSDGPCHPGSGHSTHSALTWATQPSPRSAGPRLCGRSGPGLLRRGRESVGIGISSAQPTRAGAAAASPIKPNRERRHLAHFRIRHPTASERRQRGNRLSQLDAPDRPGPTRRRIRASLSVSNATRSPSPFPPSALEGPRSTR